MREAARDRRLTDRAPQEYGPRILVVIPIVHGEADMGSFREELRRAYVEKASERAWQDSRRAIGAFWEALEARLLGLDIDWSRLRLYQDALPVCGYEREIVHDLAATGAANHRILLALMARGAVLEGTESAQLLLQERDLLARGSGEMSGDRNEAARLLRERDRFIAGRIDATLKPGETGLLFMGALHHVTALLPSTICVMDLQEFAAAAARSC